MKQLVVFTYGLSHTLLGLIPKYLENTEMAFAFSPEATQASAIATVREKVKILSKGKSKFTFISAASIAGKLRYKQYDVVYVHGVNSRFMLPALMGARLAGIPRVIACAHSGDAEPASRLPKWSFHKATASDQKLGREMFKGNIETLPDGIPSGYCLDENLREAWREALGVTDCHVYLQISSFQREGQYDQTIDNFKKILAVDEKARLICVGQGPLRSEILARIEYENLVDFVMLPGDTDNIFTFLMAADAILIPEEGTQSAPLIALAQAAGLPCFVGEKTNCEAKLISEGIYSLEELFAFRLPWEHRQHQSDTALEKARQVNRTSDEIGLALAKLAMP